MTTQTLTLTAFILQRIAEDEAVALAASNAPWTALTFYPTHSEVTNETKIDGGVIVRTPSKDDPDVEHIARHDPVRVLAECEAKRRIVALHEPDHEYASLGGFSCSTCAAWEASDYDGPPPVRWPCLTLLALADIYADHPDYRPDWRP